jgi:putative ABC transport system permease protein
MWRRKFRTFLTIFGIIIGIFALTVMGSMALKLNKMIDGGKRYITGQISVSPKGSSSLGISGGGTLPLDTLNKITKVDGVKAVAGGISMALDEPNPDDATAGVNMGIPPTLIGSDINTEFENTNWNTLDMKEGKMIDKNTAENEIAIGYTISKDKGWHLNDLVKIRGQEFKVIGIMDRTMTGPDYYVMAQLASVQKIFVEANPFLKSLKDQADKSANISDQELAKLPTETKNQIIEAKSFKVENIYTEAAVSWKDGYDSEKVSSNIKDQFGKDITVLSPKKMGEQIDKASSTMNAIILGSALLALIVGLFSIVNTMIMSISERTREIGIKKALGASNGEIAWEYTLEAGFIGLIGGMIGMGLGMLTALIINNIMASKGAEIFLIEPAFMAEVVLFSFVIGIVAGVVPAMRAAKLKVVDAIRNL